MKYGLGLAAAVLAFGLFGGAANAAGTWTGVALDLAGGYSVVTGANSEEEAKQQAIDKCANASCTALFGTESQCFSVADTPEGNYQYGWSFGTTDKGTEMIALGYCYESGFSGCATRVTQCTAPVPDATATPEAPTTPTEPPATPGPKTKTKG